jgi:hypothetical protein
MRAYHGNPALKEDLLARVAAHAAANEITKRDGYTRRPSPFHAPGATSWGRDSDAPYVAMEEQWGIPQMLAQLEDVIYQGIPYGDAKAWPWRFAESVPIGVDLSRVCWRYLHGILTEAVANIPPGIVLLGVREAVGQCAEIVGARAGGEQVDASAASRAASDADGSSLVEKSAGRRSFYLAAESAACAARSVQYSVSKPVKPEDVAVHSAMAARVAATSAESMASSVSERSPAIIALGIAIRRHEDVSQIADAAVRATEEAWSPQADLLIRLLREAT